MKKCMICENEECKRLNFIDKNKFKVSLNYLEYCLIESDFLQCLSMMLGDKEYFDKIMTSNAPEVIN